MKNFYRKNLWTLNVLTDLLKHSTKHLCKIKTVDCITTCSGYYNSIKELCCVTCKYIGKSGCKTKSISCATWHCQTGELHPNTKFRHLSNLILKCQLYKESYKDRTIFSLGYRTSNKDVAKEISDNGVNVYDRIVKCLIKLYSEEHTSKLDKKYIMLILKTLKYETRFI